MDHQKMVEQITNALDAHHYDPMNDVLFKFIFGKVERKLPVYYELSPGS